MPDLITEYFWKCDNEQRFEVPSSKGDRTYEVFIRGWEAHCTCPAHQFHPEDHCKHIRYALNVLGACRWNQLLDGGDAKEVRDSSGEETRWACPNCSGDVTSFGAAV